MASYLTLAQYKALAVIPAEFVTAIETITPGWTLAQLTSESAWINSLLTKRYDVPFADPPPAAVQRWLARIVTVSAYLKRGFDPTDKQGSMYVAMRDEAVKEIHEAADAENGLYGLPLREDTTASGISKGFPKAYSEQSPYAFTDSQARVARQEDDNGNGGTFT
jgi:hypothetical protein